MAQRFGFNVNSITLHFLGGMTEIDGAAKRPRQEFWIAVVGPLTSIAVGSGRPSGPGSCCPKDSSGSPIEGLAGANLLIGVAQPRARAAARRRPGAQVRRLGRHRRRDQGHHRRRLGRPPDGRRGARLAAASSARSSTYPRRCSTTSSSSCSACSCGPARPPRCRTPGCGRRLPHLVARPLARRTLAVPEDTPLAEAVRRAQEIDAGSIVTVTSSGRPTGIVSEAAVLATPTGASAVGRRQRRGPHPRGRAHPAGHHRRRGADHGDQPTPGRRVPPASRRTAR